MVIGLDVTDETPSVWLISSPALTLIVGDNISDSVFTHSEVQLELALKFRKFNPPTTRHHYFESSSLTVTFNSPPHRHSP